MDELITINNLIALLTLTGLEVVLGIDNIVVITIVAGKLKPSQQGFARKLGLSLAMILRILLLLCITWIMRLTTPLFAVAGVEFSGRALILLVGGLFLIAKATFEVHHTLEGAQEGPGGVRQASSFGGAIATILALDLVFSLDSVITAVGMAEEVWVMVVAVVVAVLVMLVFVGSLADFIQEHPTIKMLALSFMLLIGVMLVVEGIGQHVNKGYIYFAMGFSLIVELLNLKLIKRRSHATRSPA